MQPSPSAADVKRLLAAFLRDNKEELLRQWTLRVLDDPQVPEANRLTEPQLRDHIPRLLGSLIHSLESASSDELTGRAIGSGDAAREHARDRVTKGYALT